MVAVPESLPSVEKREETSETPPENKCKSKDRGSLGPVQGKKVVKKIFNSPLKPVRGMNRAWTGGLSAMELQAQESETGKDRKKVESYFKIYATFNPHNTNFKTGK